jgi:hypothetical protein
VLAYDSAEVAGDRILANASKVLILASSAASRVHGTVHNVQSLNQ